MTIIETIKSNNGWAYVNALTHNIDLCRTYGSGLAVKNRLIILVYEGVLVDYDDGRKVRMA